MTPSPSRHYPTRRAIDSSDAERRHQARDAVIGALWLLDNVPATVVRCNCVDVSSDGMRLAAPAGAPVQAGHSYELCSHLPGQSPPPGLGMIVSRHATVVWVSESPRGVEFGVSLDSARCRLPAESEAYV